MAKNLIPTLTKPYVFYVSMWLTKKHLDKLTYDVIGAAIEVHKSLGAGLLESVYHECLKHELTLRNINYSTQTIVPVHFKGINLETDLRCDLFIRPLAKFRDSLT